MAEQEEKELKETNKRKRIVSERSNIFVFVKGAIFLL